MDSSSKKARSKTQDRLVADATHFLLGTRSRAALFRLCSEDEEESLRVIRSACECAKGSLLARLVAVEGAVKVVLVGDQERCQPIVAGLPAWCSSAAKGLWFGKREEDLMIKIPWKRIYAETANPPHPARVLQ